MSDYKSSEQSFSFQTLLQKNLTVIDKHRGDHYETFFAGVDFGTQTSPDDYQDSSGYSWWYFLFPPGLVALVYQNYHLVL